MSECKRCLALSQALQMLTESIDAYAAEMDALMRAPASYERGRQIAGLLGQLELDRDEARAAMKEASRD